MKQIQLHRPFVLMNERNPILWGTCAGSGSGTAHGFHRTYAFRNETWPRKSISLGISIACSRDNLDRFFVVHSGSGFFFCSNAKWPLKVQCVGKIRWIFFCFVSFSHVGLLTFISGLMPMGTPMERSSLRMIWKRHRLWRFPTFHLKVNIDDTWGFTRFVEFMSLWQLTKKNTIWKLGVG